MSATAAPRCASPSTTCSPTPPSRAVGIDWYPPVSDWRDAPDHADLAVAGDIYDRAYLKARLGASGEAFDWYYADAAGRAAQDRRPIADGAYGKPWIFRPKDLVGWWSNPHVERDGGVETRATAWVPRGKPIWLTEVGVPAVDKGTNGPNVFPDPKSVRERLPAGLAGPARRADPAPRPRGGDPARFDPAAPGFAEADNPVSPVYGGRMVDPAAIFVWAWDARPLPGLPDRAGRSGRMPATGGSATGSPGGSRAATSTCWSCRSSPISASTRRSPIEAAAYPRRLRHRPAALGPRRPGDPGAGLRPRRLGGGRHPAPARAAPRPAGGARRGRPRPRSPRTRPVAAAGPGRGERPAALGRARHHRFREPGLPPRRGRRDPAGRRPAARDPDRGGDRHPPRDRRRPRRGAARPGHRGPRQRGASRSARAGSSWSPATCWRSRPTCRAARCCAGSTGSTTPRPAAGSRRAACRRAAARARGLRPQPGPGRPVAPPAFPGPPFALALDLPVDRGSPTVAAIPRGRGRALARRGWRSGARTGTARRWRSTAASTTRPASAGP